MKQLELVISAWYEDYVRSNYNIDEYDPEYPTLEGHGIAGDFECELRMLLDTEQYTCHYWGEGYFSICNETEEIGKFTLEKYKP